MTERIRVLIVDDHPIVREGLQALISTESNLLLAGEATTGKEAIRLVDELEPDVMLLDLIMKPVSGIEVIHQIKSLGLDVKILVLTSFGNEDLVFQAVKAGAQGYLLKDTPPKLLVQAIHDVYHGMPSLAPSVATQLIQELQEAPHHATNESRVLTERETLILKHVAQGLTNQEIADKLIISERTVRTHMANILRKLHLANRTQAALFALREGIATLND